MKIEKNPFSPKKRHKRNFLMSLFFFLNFKIFDWQPFGQKTGIREREWKHSWFNNFDSIFTAEGKKTLKRMKWGKKSFFFLDDGNCQHFPFFCFLCPHLISHQRFFSFLHKISDQIFLWLFRGNSHQLHWPGGGECHCR